MNKCLPYPPPSYKHVYVAILLGLAIGIAQTASAQTVFQGTSWDLFPNGAVAVCNDSDIDNDDDGLIELCHLEDLNAMRYQLDGSGYKASQSAGKITTGCPNSGCKGYELVRNLDFQDDDSYSSTANKVIWTTGSGWLTMAGTFSAILEGNGYAIANLKMSNLTANANVGFIQQASGSIQNFALTNVDVEVRLDPLPGNQRGGVLLRELSEGGRVINSYIQGELKTIIGLKGFAVHIAPFIGINIGTISSSYVDMMTSGYSLSGSFVDRNDNRRSRISNSYAKGAINVTNTHALSGFIRENNGTIANILQRVITPNSLNPFRNRPLSSQHFGTIRNSYWDEDNWKGTEGSDANAVDRNEGSISNSRGFSTVELQTPTAAGATNTVPYYNWSEDNWDFGTTVQYPALRHAIGNISDNPACRNNPSPQGSQQPKCRTLLLGQRPLLGVRIRPKVFLEGPLR